MLHHEGTPKTSSPRICDIIKNKHGIQYELLQKKMIGKCSYLTFFLIQQSILKGLKSLTNVLTVKICYSDFDNSNVI